MTSWPPINRGAAAASCAAAIVARLNGPFSNAKLMNCYTHFPTLSEESLSTEPKDDSFKVIDRRLFTAEGELRNEVAREIEAEEKAAPAAKSGGKPPLTSPSGAAAEPSPVSQEAATANPNWRLLVDFLLQNAAFMLGNPDPRTGQSMLDLEGARYMIDLFDVLREKTRSNLTLEEEQLLTDVIGKLKLAYMDVTKATAAAATREKAGSRKP